MPRQRLAHGRGGVAGYVSRMSAACLPRANGAMTESMMRTMTLLLLQPPLAFTMCTPPPNMAFSLSTPRSVVTDLTTTGGSLRPEAVATSAAVKPWRMSAPG